MPAPDNLLVTTCYRECFLKKEQLLNTFGVQGIVVFSISVWCLSNFGPFELFSVKQDISLYAKEEEPADLGKGQTASCHLPQTADYALSHLKDWDLEIMHI